MESVSGSLPALGAEENMIRWWACEAGPWLSMRLGIVPLVGGADSAAIQARLKMCFGLVAYLQEALGEIGGSELATKIAALADGVVLETLRNAVVVTHKRRWTRSWGDLVNLWETSPSMNWRTIRLTWPFALGTLEQKALLVSTLIPKGLYHANWSGLAKEADVGKRETAYLDMLKALEHEDVLIDRQNAPVSVAAVGTTDSSPFCRGCKKRHPHPHCCKVCRKAHKPPYCKPYSVMSLGNVVGASVVEVMVGTLRTRALLDTGAQLSCVSSRVAEACGASQGRLRRPFVAALADGQATVRRKVDTMVTIGGGRRRQRFFVLEQCPFDVILGVDFLFAESAPRVVWRPDARTIRIGSGVETAFVVNQASSEVVADPGVVAVAAGSKAALTGSTDAKAALTDACAGLRPDRRENLLRILAKNLDAFTEKLERCGQSKCPKVDVRVKPVYDGEGNLVRPYLWRAPRSMSNMSENERKVMAEFIESSLRSGLISEVRPEDDPFQVNFNHVFAPKKDGSIRVCGDLVPINQGIELEPQIVPRMADLVARASGKRFISLFDMPNAYSMCGLADDAKQYFRFSHDGKRYQYEALPFGYHNAPTRFQRWMDTLFGDVPGTAVYLDDVCIMSDTWEEHCASIERVLERARENGMFFKPSKCKFAVPSLVFLGYVISAEGKVPDPDKMEAIASMAVPEDVRGVRRFLAMAGRYSDFIADFARRVAHLSTMRKKHAKFRWSEECESEFRDVQKELLKLPLLHHYDPSAPLRLYVDASGTGFGASLVMVDGDVEKPIAFWSRELTLEEGRYEAGKLELSGLYTACRKFRPFIHGRDFDAFTDHEPLVGTLRRGVWEADSDDKVARMVAWLNGLRMNLQYIEGEANVVADWASRQRSASVGALGAIGEDDAGLAAWASRQRRDAWCWRKISRLAADGKVGGFEVREGVLFRVEGDKWRIVVPKSDIERVIRLYHEAAHFGPEKTRADIAAKFWWSDLANSVKAWCRKCERCMQKSDRPVDVGVKRHVPTGSRPWQVVSIDAIGKLPRSRSGNCWVLVIICNFSKRVHVRAVQYNDTRTFVRWFREVMAAEGIPEVVVSDNGGNFTAKEVEELFAANNIKHVRTPPHHPQSNGDVERFNRTLGASIRAASDGTGNDPSWDERLWSQVLAYNNSKHASTLLAPNEVAQGRLHRQQLDFEPESGMAPDEAAFGLAKKLEENVAVVVERLKVAALRNEREGAKEALEELRVGMLVWMLDKDPAGARKLAHPWTGPWRIVEQEHPDIFVVVDVKDERRRMRRHRSMLRRCHRPDEVGVEEFPVLPLPVRGGGWLDGLVDEGEYHYPVPARVEEVQAQGGADGGQVAIVDLEAPVVRVNGAVEEQEPLVVENRIDLGVAGGAEPAAEAPEEQIVAEVEIVPDGPQEEARELVKINFERRVKKAAINDELWSHLDNERVDTGLSLAEVATQRGWPTDLQTLAARVDLEMQSTKRSLGMSLRSTAGFVHSRYGVDRLVELCASKGWTERKMAIATEILQYISEQN